MKLTYNEFVFAQLACEYDEEFRNLEYDIQFPSIPIRYKYFEESEFNDEDFPEYDCIVKYLIHRKYLKGLIKAHDFTYEYSDDNTKYKLGSENYERIVKHSKRLTGEDFRDLWNTYAPEPLKLKV